MSAHLRIKKNRVEEQLRRAHVRIEVALERLNAAEDSLDAERVQDEIRQAQEALIQATEQNFKLVAIMVADKYRT